MQLTHIFPLFDSPSCKGCSTMSLSGGKYGVKSHFRSRLIVSVDGGAEEIFTIKAVENIGQMKETRRKRKKISTRARKRQSFLTNAAIISVKRSI